MCELLEPLAQELVLSLHDDLSLENPIESYGTN